MSFPQSASPCWLGRGGERKFSCTVTPAEAKRAEVNAWKRYTAKFNEPAMKARRKQYKSMPKNLSAADRVAWATKNMQKLEAIESMELGYWQSRLGQPRAALVKGSLPYLVGLIGAIFQYQAMSKLGEDEQKAMSHEKVESRYRLGAGIGAFWGTVADLSGQGLAKAAPLVPKVARGLEVIARWAVRLGRAAGIIGAGMVAYWDGKAAWKSKQEGQYGMAILYLASAGLGFGAAFILTIFASTAWAGPVALILIGLLIAVAVLIEFFKDNKIQEWLKRCWWGNGPDAKYRDVEKEMSELKAAVS